MNRSAVFSIAIVAALLALPTRGITAEEDALFGPDRPWYGGRRTETFIINADHAPLYFRPTQRYYGPGYTISYRYVPVYSTDSIYGAAVTASSNFRDEAFRLPASSAVTWGAGGPRLVVKDAKSSVTREAVTAIIRRKTAPSTTSKPAKDAEPTYVPSTEDSAPVTPASGAPVAKP